MMRALIITLSCFLTFTRAWRRSAAALERVPGASSLRTAPSPSVAATIANGTKTASSTEPPLVLTMIVCPEITAVGACPVCNVVTP